METPKLQVETTRNQARFESFMSVASVDAGYLVQAVRKVNRCTLRDFVLVFERFDNSIARPEMAQTGIQAHRPGQFYPQSGSARSSLKPSIMFLVRSIMRTGPSVR